MAKKEAWVISVNMGYGHQRAAYPFKDIAYERIITANSDKIVTPKESKMWGNIENLYNSVSRARSIPLIGEYLWRAYDYMQSITPYYPFRDLSAPTLGTRVLNWYIRKGLLKSVIEHCDERDIPFLTTFFAPGVAAGYYHRKQSYCITCDADINRIWVPNNPKKDRVCYFTSSVESAERLASYGVPKGDIFFTGFPLPKENTGTDMEILKRDMGYRLPNLDPNKVHINRYRAVIKDVLGKHYRTKSNHPLTLTLAIGGAGAQTEICDKMLKSLKNSILKHRIRVNIMAGTHLDKEQHFKELITKIKLSKELGKFVNIYSAQNKKDYFQGFNEVLHTTDILWTKPSELVFFCALGIPIIIAPPLGSQEILNKQWLVKIGGGIPQERPEYIDDWLFDWLRRGMLEQAAWRGMMEAPKYGTYNIEGIMFSRNKAKVRLRY